MLRRGRTSALAVLCAVACGGCARTVVEHPAELVPVRRQTPSAGTPSGRNDERRDRNLEVADPDEAFANDADVKPLVGSTETSYAFRSDPISVESDLRGLPPMLARDAVGVVDNWRNLTLLGAGLGGSLALRGGVDENVRADTAEHPQRWGEASRVVGRFGEAPYQIPAIAAVYAYSVFEQDEELHDFSRSMVSSYTLMGLSTLAAKGIANTDRPSDEWNGGNYGFPSFHVASLFNVAAVVEEHYGTLVALPAYGLGGTVAWTRIDERDHDVSDVAFGAVLGWVIGKSVARGHLEGDSRVRLLPWRHPAEGGTGVAVETTY